MNWLVLADLVLVCHFAFAIFVVFGGVLSFRYPKVAWLHVPCLAYGVAIEAFGWICPLTPLERRLRERAGQHGYEGGFLDHYLGGVLYPEDWPAIHLWLGAALLVFNALVYGLLVRRAMLR